MSFVVVVVFFLDGETASVDVGPYCSRERAGNKHAINKKACHPDYRRQTTLFTKNKKFKKVSGRRCRSGNGGKCDVR